MQEINLKLSKSDEIFPSKLLMDMTPRRTDSNTFRCFSDENGWNMDKINEFSLTSNQVKSEENSSGDVPANGGLRSYLVNIWNGFWKRNSKKNLLEKKNKNDFYNKNVVEMTSLK